MRFVDDYFLAVYLADCLQLNKQNWWSHYSTLGFFYVLTAEQSVLHLNRKNVQKFK